MFALGQPHFYDLAIMEFKFKHLLLWFALYYYIVWGGLHEYILRGNIEWPSVTSTPYDITSFVSLFLWWCLGYLVFYLYYPKKKWLHLFMGIILSICIPIVFRYLVEQWLFLKLFGLSNYPSNVALIPYFKDNYFMASQFVPMGVIYYFIRHSISKSKREKDLVIENQKMQLSLLQSQINPHFLLNTLNNVQALVHMKSDKATAAIDQLSDFLKYNLYESKTYTSVDNELNIIDKYIALESLRHEKPLAVKVEIDPAARPAQIPQHLLLPLMENAFKHANLKSVDQPVLLKLKKSMNKLQIHSSNVFGQKNKDKHSGIGLDNLRKRLGLLYDDDFDMKITKADGRFAIDMEIPLA